jgi:SAM-dependent methyltransferase
MLRGLRDRLDVVRARFSGRAPLEPVTREESTEADLHEVRQVWEAQAESDPLWAILSEPDKRGRKWNLREFLATGGSLVASLLDRADAAGADQRYGTAVDFGCGIGRLSQALAGRYAAVMGIDVSQTMIGIAKRVNRHGERVTYLHNPSTDLAPIDDGFADLVFSVITLQHIRPSLAESYVHEFFRIAKPGGLIIFHVPSHIHEDYLLPDAVDAPLPPDACRAHLALATDAPPEVPAGGKLDVRVLVRNDSDVGWTQALSFPLNLGSQWTDALGSSVILYDDGRARLPARLPPHTEAALTLTVTAPVEPGEYQLRLDLVQEGIRWFQDLGHEPLSVPLEVRPAPSTSNLDVSAPSTTYDFGGLISKDYAPAKAFEMHGIPKSRVVQIVADYGARLLAADEQVTEWVSYVYYIQKRRTP